MKFELTKSDIVVKDPIFLQLGMDDEAHALRLNRGNAMDILKEKNVSFGRVSSELPTLNDVFLTITGKELRDME